MKFIPQDYIKYPDKDGKITSIFVAVVVDNEAGVLKRKEHWLTESEKTDVIADESKLQPILEKLAAQGKLEIDNETLNKPNPPIVADKAKRESFVLTPQKVATKETEVKKEIEDRKKAEENARLEREKAEKEAQDARIKAENDAKNPPQDSNNKPAKK